MRLLFSARSSARTWYGFRSVKISAKLSISVEVDPCHSMMHCPPASGLVADVDDVSLEFMDV